MILRKKDRDAGIQTKTNNKQITKIVDMRQGSGYK